MVFVAARAQTIGELAALGLDNSPQSAYFRGRFYREGAIGVVSKVFSFVVPVDYGFANLIEVQAELG